MGKQQTKNRFIYGACLVIIFTTGFQAYSQKTYQSIYLQNAFYQQFSLFDEDKRLAINNQSTQNCDTIVGVIKPLFLKEIKEDTSQKIWLIASIFRFDFEGGEFAFVKTYQMKDTTIIGVFTFEFFKKGKCWEVRKIPLLSNTQIVIHYLKPDSFWAFYNHDKSQFPEIDAIKSQFKDSEGILDIDKLGAYLKTKPKALEKYCDW